MAYRVKGHHLGAVNPSQVASAIIRQKKKQADYLSSQQGES